MPTSGEIRQQFIDYFRDRREHGFVPSSPVVPHDDPTLLFANAGMNQFKPVFLGTEKPEGPRAVNTQKCIRAGGKHNDLDDVGKDTYHHTFFEMLGNWSFGDYFKAEAIEWAWDLLVNVWGLEPERLHATYFEGNPDQGLEPDHEAKALWLAYLPEARVHPGPAADNFWEMGETGPCGPCSEIHYDRTDDLTGASLVNADDPRVIEIWNLVFIQFNRSTEGTLSALPAKHVDTGMGFERIVAVLQGKTSNYDTDVFTPLFEAIQAVTKAPAYTGSLKKPEDIAYRVIADHIRCLTFALTDGAHCGNEGRDYVLRRILRRAVRYGRQTLNVEEPFFYRLVPAVVDLMGQAFAELHDKQEAVAEELREEEESFHRTLDRGIKLFENAAERAGSANVITGEDAFKLYDTYGFPLDLTQLMAEERGMSVDTDQFEHLMERQRERSRGGQEADHRASLVDRAQEQALPETQFVGYERTTLEGEITPLSVFRLGQLGYESTERAGSGDHVALVTARTPFYAEAGGQVGDTGAIEVTDQGQVRVEETMAVGSHVFHLGEVTTGTIQPGDNAKLTFRVDEDRRARIRQNHTATHLLNRALRDQVNPDTQQKGSLVDDQRLRFDFSQDQQVSEDQLAAVEQQVNADIAADSPVYAELAPQKQALEIHGLRAVFGEKYPPEVRVVSIGVPPTDLLGDPGNENWRHYSIEFCGGTHLPSTGRAHTFCLIGEEGVAKGVRRVTALSGEQAQQAINDGEQMLQRLDALLDAPTDAGEMDRDLDGFMSEQEDRNLPLTVRRQIRTRLGELNQRQKQKDKAEGEKAQNQAVGKAHDLAEKLEGPVITAHLTDTDAKSLRTAMDVLSKQHPASAVLLAGTTGEKVALVASVPQRMIDQGLKAGDWIKQAAHVVGGGGGGKDDLAQAGGKEPDKADEALETARDYAQNNLG